MIVDEGPAPKKQRERHNCCVPQCKNVQSGEIHLHKVPKDTGNRQKWAQAIKTGKTLGNVMKVCSQHFNKEDYIISTGCGLKPRLKKYAVPSQKLPMRLHDKVLSSPVKRKQVAREERVKERAKRKLSTRSDSTEDLTDPLPSGGSYAGTSNDSAGVGVLVGSAADWVDLGQFTSEEEQKLKQAGVQVDLLSKNSGVVTTLLSDDKRLLSATGLHSIKLLNSLSMLFDEIAPDTTQKKFMMCTCDRIVLTMMKIKLSISFSALAALFDTNVQTCCNYFKDTVIVLSKILKCAVFWPDKEKVLKNMPKCFAKYKCTRVILDAYEIPLEKPKCILCRVRLYSHYKKNFTAKIMMLCSPSGLITHCSPAFGGRASDKVVTLNTGVYDLCDPGDGIMVDKGFNIDEECHNHLLKLIRPPFMRNKKFSTAESVECAKIARARVHVERIIQRVRQYHFLSNKVPWNLCPYLDNIIIIVSGLVNLSKPILAMDKF